MDGADGRDRRATRYFATALCVSFQMACPIGRSLVPASILLISSMSLIVGIDLGTTNSLIGAMDAGFPILLADADGERLTPSTVYFPEHGEPHVGRAASRMRMLDPVHTVYSVKRFIGRRAGEEADDVSYA